MQDPKITLITALKNGWLLTGDLAAANIRFSTGWFEKGLDTPHVSVTEDYSTDGYFDVKGIYQIDIEVKVIKGTNKGRGLAKKHKWEIVEEVKRILKANKTGLTDLQYIRLNNRGKSLDELKRSPPLLKYRLRLSVFYSV